MNWHETLALPLFDFALCELIRTVQRSIESEFRLEASTALQKV